MEARLSVGLKKMGMYNYFTLYPHLSLIKVLKCWFLELSILPSLSHMKNRCVNYLRYVIIEMRLD